MFLDPKSRNEGTKPERRYKKPERVYIRQNCPFCRTALLFPRENLLASPFREGLKSTWEIQRTQERGLVPQISSDWLKPVS